MKISFAPYELIPRGSGSLNSRSVPGGPRKGALLRVEYDFGFGYADLHPWTEFDDAPLNDQLKMLHEGQPSNLAFRSLEFARQDARLRLEKRSAFEGLKIPASHFLFSDLLSVDSESLRAAVEAGFQTVKVKCGKNPDAELHWWQKLASEWPEELKLRLDMNASLEFEEASRYLEKIPPSLRAKIEFVEDPCAFAAEDWARLQKQGFALALDLEANHLTRIIRAVKSNAASFIVLKPAVQEIEPIFEALEPHPSVRIVFTSYLDHPLGQVCAAWEAARFMQRHLQSVSACGLLSHFAYEPNEFSKAIVTDGPWFLPPAGPGFGFDDLLRKQNWVELKAETFT